MNYCTNQNLSNDISYMVIEFLVTSLEKNGIDLETKRVKGFLPCGHCDRDVAQGVNSFQACKLTCYI